jgi:hypothetical protein
VRVTWIVLDHVDLETTHVVKLETCHGPFRTWSSPLEGDLSESSGRLYRKCCGWGLRNSEFLLTVPVSDFKAHSFVLWLYILHIVHARRTNSLIGDIV